MSSPDRLGEALQEPFAALIDICQCVVILGTDLVDGRELEVPLGGRRAGHLVAHAGIGDAIEQARAGRDDEARHRDQHEQQDRHAALGPDPTQQHGHGAHQSHVSRRPCAMPRPCRSDE